MDIKKILNYRRIPGVWAIWGKDDCNSNVCLDVHETVNVGKEMKWVHKRALDGKKRKKYKLIFERYAGIEFIAVALYIESVAERKLIETQYAQEHKALYWHKPVETISVS